MAGLEMRYFVLKPRGSTQHAVASREALETYADHIESTNPQLAADIRDWIQLEINRQYEVD